MVDCAITGTLSGNEIGLPNVTSYIYPMAISWGLSFFGANAAAWDALPPDLQATLREAIAGLEAQIWDASDRETAVGIACDIGAPDCGNEHSPSHMTLVPVTAQDEATRKRLLVELVLPGWIHRCGPECVTAWNQELAPRLVSRPRRTEPRSADKCRAGTSRPCPRLLVTPGRKDSQPAACFRASSNRR